MEFIEIVILVLILFWFVMLFFEKDRTHQTLSIIFIWILMISFNQCQIRKQLDQLEKNQQEIIKIVQVEEE